MDTSTDGVTLLSAFVFDVLSEYKHTPRKCRPIFEMAKHLDPDATDEWCSMELYNQICTWVEENIGPASIRHAGIAIGSRAYDNIVAQGKIDNPTPLGMMEALVWAASTMIKDPKGRGWEIVSHDETSLVMKRTQTFNCLLQDGLLLSLVRRCDVKTPSVKHASCERDGAEFCIYDISWRN